MRLPEYVHEANIAGLERKIVAPVIKRPVAPNNTPARVVIFARLYELTGFAALAFYEAVTPQDFDAHLAFDIEFAGYCEAQRALEEGVTA